MGTVSARRESSPADAAVDTARAALGSVLALEECSFELWPFDALLPRIERGRIVLPRDAVGARSYASWTPADGIELPVRIDGMRLGRFVLVTSMSTTGVALSSSARDRALDIAEQCATALAARLTEGVQS